MKYINLVFLSIVLFTLSSCPPPLDHGYGNDGGGKDDKPLRDYSLIHTINSSSYRRLRVSFRDSPVSYLYGISQGGTQTHILPSEYANVPYNDSIAFYTDGDNYSVKLKKKFDHGNDILELLEDNRDANGQGDIVFKITVTDEMLK